MAWNFTKLDHNILDSSLWSLEYPTRICWITLLAMANQTGKINSTAPGITHRARITEEECRKALAIFESPDPDSRTPDNDGRRIQRVDGGYQILNYEKYKGHSYSDSPGAVRVRKHRDKKKQALLSYSSLKKEVRQEETRESNVTVTNCNVTVTDRIPSASRPDPEPEGARSSEPRNKSRDSAASFSVAGTHPWDADKSYQALLKILPQDSKGFAQKNHEAYPLFKGAVRQIGLSALLGAAETYRKAAEAGNLERLQAVHYWLRDQTYLKFKAVPKTVFKEKKNVGTDDSVVAFADRFRAQRTCAERAGQEGKRTHPDEFAPAQNVGAGS